MMVRRTTIALLFICALFVSTPFMARAQTVEQLRTQIADILAQIQTLRAQLQGQTQAEPTTVIPVSTNTGVSSANGLATFQYSRCPDLQFNLERGMRDAEVAVEVTMLQRFFAQDASLYPEGEITGYFGPATERAVQRFQERHGIVTYGDYQATGYGRVGPRTRHAIKNSCGVVSEEHAFTVTPTTGEAPLRVTSTFEFKGSSCTSYQLDWGDGSTPVSNQAPSTSSCSSDIVQKTASHTYANAGTYVIALRIGKGPTQLLPVVAQTNITVGGGTNGTGGLGAVLSTTPIQGAAPLSVQTTLRSNVPTSCTSYEIDWGDNSQPIQYEASSFDCISLDSFSKQFTHIYTSPGTYTIRARAGRGSIASLGVAQQHVTVSLATQTPTTSSGCFVSPNNGSAPLDVRARILLGGTLCDGNLTYRVDWGDGEVSPTQVCSDTNSHYGQLTHIYATPGAYTARLQQSHPNARFEEQTCSVAVSRATSDIPSGVITNLCQSWTDGCNTCTRAYEGAPAACTKRYCLQAGTPQCYQYFSSGGNSATGGDDLSYRIINSSTRTVEFTALINTNRDCNGGVYTIYFGDSEDSVQPYPADVCQAFTRTVTHTYAQPGTYNAFLLKNGVTLDQVTFSVSGSSQRNENLASVITAIENFIRGLFK